MKDLKDHPYSKIFPLMEDFELKELAADIEQFGQRDLIIIFEDQILDGRNRYRACKIAGVEPKLKDYTGKDPLGYVISKNFKRRQLTTKQRAEVALKIANLTKGRPEAKAPNGAAKKVTQKVAAKLAGVSRRTVQRVKASQTPKKKAPEPGWTKAELEKDQELSDHFTMIEAVYGKPDTDAIRKGTIPFSRADVLFLGKMPKENMEKIRDLIFTTGWAPKKCVEFINSEPDDETKVRHLKYLCLTTKGKYWTHVFGGFTCTMKANEAAQR